MVDHSLGDGRYDDSEAAKISQFETWLVGSGAAYKMGKKMARKIMLQKI
jgi:hypothetical protein